MAKPDDRSDNAEKLRNAVQNTKQNLEEANEYLDEHADEISSQELSSIQQNNENRKRSIEGMEEEIQDESNR